MSLWWGANPLDELIDKATSEYIPIGQENLALHLEISDEIRSKKVNSKDAMRSLKRRLTHKNPNVVLATLNLTDTCVKNSGDAFVREIASREFIDELVSLLRSPTGCNIDVKNKILSIVQTWGLAAKGKPTLSYMTDTYYLLQAEGYVFPPMTDSVDAILLETSAAPEWTDSDVCERCRTPFTMTNRKHHCRQCGKTFCQQCSSKNMSLPHLAIIEEVRVCDGCYIKLKLAKVAKKDTIPSTFGSAAAPIPAFLQQYSDTPESVTANRSIPRTSATTTTTTTTTAQATDDDFDEDMKKAIELSLKEEEARKNSYGAGYTPSQQLKQEQRQEVQPVTTEEEDDPDLAAAIAASLRDMEINNNTVSQRQQETYNTRTRNRDELSTVEIENIQLFSTLVERVHTAAGDISRDPQINKLYTQIGTLQPKLVKNLDETDRKHRIFVDLHEKMNMAVKAYDQLLEQRVSGAHFRTTDRIPPSTYYSSSAAPTIYTSSTTSTTPTTSNSLYPTVQPPSLSQYGNTSSDQYQQQQPYQPSYPSVSGSTTSNQQPYQSSYPSISSPTQNIQQQYHPVASLPQQQQQQQQQLYYQPIQQQQQPSQPPSGYPPQQITVNGSGNYQQTPIQGYQETTTRQYHPGSQIPQQQQQSTQQEQQQQQQPAYEAPLIDL